MVYFLNIITPLKNDSDLLQAILTYLDMKSVTFNIDNINHFISSYSLD